MKMSVGDVIAVLQAVRDIKNIIEATFAFSGECQGLKEKCEAIDKILDGNTSFENTEEFTTLRTAVSDALSYLKDCRKRRFVRNPLFEVLFHSRIEKYTRIMNDWIVIAILSVDVRIERALTESNTIVSETRHVSKQTLGVLKRMEEKMTDFTFLAERVQRLGVEDHRYSNPAARSELWKNVPVIAPEDVEIPKQPDGHEEFIGSLRTGDAVRFVPLERNKIDTPRLLVVYGEISRSVGIQRLFGIYSGRFGDYAVMEDLEVEVVLQDILANVDTKIKMIDPLARLKLCLDLATCIAYLHSIDLIVKVISDSSVYIRNVTGNLVPILVNLQHARLLLSFSDNYSYDERYDPPEYGMGKGRTHSKDTDIWSLGILLWQILKFQSLPSSIGASGFMASFSRETDQTIVNLIGDCFDRQPPKRPHAFVLMQRLMDEYNRRCAEAEGRTVLVQRFEKCRNLVNARRLCSNSPPDETFSEADVRVLLEYDESWESEGSGLRLAPEALFLIGAGLLWGLADPHHLSVPPTVVGRGSSSIEVYKTKLSIFYLTKAIEMGYNDAAMELARAHAFLADWYGENGGDAVASSVELSKLEIEALSVSISSN